MNTSDPCPLTAAHAVDDQLQARLDELRTQAISQAPAGDDTALQHRRALRALLACVNCLDAVRTSHPLDADGWCVPCTAPPGAPELSTIYGCMSRVTLARYLLGLYSPSTRLSRPPINRGSSTADEPNL